MIVLVWLSIWRSPPQPIDASGDCAANVSTAFSGSSTLKRADIGLFRHDSEPRTAPCINHCAN